MNGVKRDSAPRKAVELAVFSIILGGINAFFPDMPGFLSGFFNPYLVLAIFVAVLYGKYHAFLSLLISTVVVAVALPFLTGAAGDLPGYWVSLWQTAPIPLAVTLAELYLLGLIRDSLTRRRPRPGSSSAEGNSPRRGTPERESRGDAQRLGVRTLAVCFPSASRSH